MRISNQTKHGVFFHGIAIVAWLFAAGVAHALGLHTAEIYRSEPAAPFTLHLWWRATPWIAVFVLTADYMLTCVFDGKLACPRFQALRCFLFLGAALLFIILSFLPFCVFIGRL